MTEHTTAPRPPITKKRVLFSSNAAWNLVNYRGGLIREMLAAGHHVITVAPVDRHADTLERWGCTFLPLSMEATGLSPRADLALLHRFGRIFREHRPDIVFSYTVKNNIWGALAARSVGIPLVPNVSGLGSAFQHKGWLRNIVTRLYRLAFRRLPLVFFQNEDDQARFEALKIVRPGQSARLPGSGVDLARFSASPLPGRGDQVTFLLIARMLWEKGVGDYVAAARRVRQRYPEAQFQLLGFVDVDNPTAISLDQMMQWSAAPGISYLGESDDVRRQIAAADCIVLPTAYGEGTPRTLLEAGGMGRPIITTMVPGCREILRDGTNGFACRPKDVESLADAMTRMIDIGTSGRAELGCGARKVVENEYSERRVIAAYLSALERYG